MSDPSQTSIKSIFPGILAIITIAIVSLGFIWGLVLIVKLLDSNVTVTIVSAAATIFVSIISLLIAKYAENRQKIDQENRLRKVPVYEEHLQIIFKVLYATKSGKDPISDKEIVRAFAAFTEKLLLWGSEDVIIAWTKFRLATCDTEQPLPYFQLWGAFLKALRRDIGMHDKKITDVALLSLFINDIEQFYKDKKS